MSTSFYSMAHFIRAKEEGINIILTYYIYVYEYCLRLKCSIT